MSYKRFKLNDLFYNAIKAKPRFEFKIFNGSLVINNGSSAAIFGDLHLTPPTESDACVISFDFSCDDNSFHVSLI